MSVHGITSTSTAYEAYQASQPVKTNTETAAANVTATEDVAAVYEPSKESETSKSQSVNYAQNTELVNKLKADAEAHTQQLQNIVQQLMTKQGQTYNTANDIWKFLASGNFTVDAATKEQAQEVHAFIRAMLAEKYSDDVAQEVSILYGGSCNAKNARELFAQTDVDGGLIGGASLKAADFIEIARSF